MTNNLLEKSACGKAKKRPRPWPSDKYTFHHSLYVNMTEYVDNFTYLGSNISSKRNLEKDVKNRMGKAA